MNIMVWDRYTPHLIRVVSTMFHFFLPFALSSDRHQPRFSTRLEDSKSDYQPASNRARPLVTNHEPTNVVFPLEIKNKPQLPRESSINIFYERFDERKTSILHPWSEAEFRKVSKKKPEFSLLGFWTVFGDAQWWPKEMVYEMNTGFFNALTTSA